MYYFEYYGGAELKKLENAIETLGVDYIHEPCDYDIGETQEGAFYVDLELEEEVKFIENSIK